MPSRNRKNQPILPSAPGSIRKGSDLGELLDRKAIDALIHNLTLVHPEFNGAGFRRACLTGLAPLSLMQRGHHFARALHAFLPQPYSKAIEVLLASLTPPQERTEGLGLAGFFYLPHVTYVGSYGLDASHNHGRDPFPLSMKAQHELTRRFTAEFSMRHFLIHQPERTLQQLMAWTDDPDPHVRRLCSEGSRPRLPWACRIPAFIKDPRPTLPILEALRDDTELYVRRSVANHLGDIAKDHRPLMFAICRKWLKGASDERCWLIRHALRHPAGKGDAEAIRLRKQAGGR